MTEEKILKMKIYAINYLEKGCWMPGREEEKGRFARVLAKDEKEAINTILEISDKTEDKINVTNLIYEGESFMNKRMILHSDVFSCPVYYEEHMKKIERRKSGLERIQNDYNDNIDGDADSHNWGSSWPSVIW